VRAGLRKTTANGEKAAVNEPLVPRLNEFNRSYQFAPRWSTDELTALSSLGLTAGDFQSIRHDGQTVASAALWDQRIFKQTVIRGYSRGLTFARPLINLGVKITNGFKLPAPGETLAGTFVSHIAVDNNRAETFKALLAELLDQAEQRGIGIVTTGFAADDPRLALVRRSGCRREYRSRIYVVSWPGCGGTAADIAPGILAPEVALL
jgi:hypothetical protein